MPGPALLLALALAQNEPSPPLSGKDIELLETLLAPTSTPAWSAPQPWARTVPALRLVEPLSRSVDEALDIAPLPLFGPSGDARLRTERLWGWFVEPSVGGWSELPPELFGQVRLQRDPIAARADVEGAVLEAWGDRQEGFQSWASARSADRSVRGAGRGATRIGPLDLRLAAFGEGSDGLLRVRRPTDDSATDEPTDSRLTRRVRAGGLGRVGIGDARARLELLGAIDGRVDRRDDEPGPAAFGPQHVVRHIVGVGAVFDGAHRLSLRASRQGASYGEASGDRVDPVLYAWEVDGALRAGPWRIGLHHLGASGRSPADEEALRLEAGPRLGFEEGPWRLHLAVGGLHHAVGLQDTSGWTGAAELSWGRTLRVGAELKKGIQGLAAMGRPSLVPDANQRSVRAAGLLAWTPGRGHLRLRAGPLLVDPSRDGAAVADLRFDGGVRLFGEVSLHGALGYISPFPQTLRSQAGRSDLRQDGVFVRSSLRWDPQGGVLELHAVGRGGSTGDDNDFIRVGGYAGLDFGRSVWVRVSIENALDAQLPETFIGEPAGVDLSVALSWEN